MTVNKKRVVIIGTGGLAREFTDWFYDQIDIVGYSSNNEQEFYDYYLPEKFFGNKITPEIAKTIWAVIAIGTPGIKEKIAKELSVVGFCFPSFIHYSNVIASTASISSRGVIVFPQCIISSDVVLKDFSYVNFQCGIGHDAEIGEFVQINPGSQIGGHTIIGKGTLVGSGSTIIQKINVGKNVVVGSGSTVFTDVPDDTTVMGNPAKRIITNG